MTALGIIQIIYLVINAVGLVSSLRAYFTSSELLTIKFLNFTEKYCGKLIALCVSVLFILLYIPVIVINAIFITFLIICGSYLT